MITRDNIIHFYEKYKRNLKIEEQAISKVLDAEDQEAWMENRLNDELAEDFLNQIIEADD